MRLALLLLCLGGGLAVAALILGPSLGTDSRAGAQANAVPSREERVQLCAESVAKEKSGQKVTPAVREAICSCFYDEVSQSFQPKEEALIVEIGFLRLDESVVGARIREWPLDEQKNFTERARAFMKNLRSMVDRCIDEALP